MSEYKKSGGFGGNRDNRDYPKKDFGRPSFGGGRPDFKRTGGSRSGGGSAQMFSTTCSECNKSCEVPFRPSGSKPVYCSNCFNSKREGPSRDNSGRDNSINDYPKREFNKSEAPKPQFDDKKIDDLKNQFNTLNIKLDKLIEMMGKNATPVASAQVSKPAVVVKKVTVAPVKAVVAPKKEDKKVIAAPKKVEAKVVLKKKPVTKKK